MIWLRPATAALVLEPYTFAQTLWGFSRSWGKEREKKNIKLRGEEETENSIQIIMMKNGLN